MLEMIKCGDVIYYKALFNSFKISCFIQWERNGELLQCIFIPCSPRLSAGGVPPLPGADCAGAKVTQTRNGAQDAI